MKTFIAGIVVFSFFFSIGLLLARHKPLWNDELYGQQETVQKTSWPNIILGHSKEWNSFPLYTMFQKGFLQLFNYQLPITWNGSGMLINPQAQLLIRILPDLFIASAMTSIVLFFGFRSGFIGGVMAVLICLSIPTVWMYWVEARPYSLWFALTTFQSLLFIDCNSKNERNPPLFPLMLVHLGLCLTAPLGIMQTVVCQGLWWCAGVRRIKFHMLAGLCPVFLGAYYLMAQQKMSMYLFASWQEILFRNFPLHEMMAIGMYIVLLFLSFYTGSFRQYFLYGRVFLPFCLTFVIIALAGLYYTIMKAVPQSAPVVERHFIFLTPIGIIMMAAIFSDLWLLAARHWWWRLGLMIIFAAGVLGQFLTTFAIVYPGGYY